MHQKIRKLRWNKLLIIALLLSLMFGQAAYAETGGAAANTVPKSTFSDVTSGHNWAKKHIAKLSLLGVINGKSETSFDPDGPITQEQAVLMAVNLMGLQNEIDKNTALAFPFTVSNYARPYVMLAIDKGFIDLQEEIAANQAANTDWGTKPATREWIAKMTIRTIGKKAMAAELSGQLTSFTDHYDITPSFVEFVKAASDLKIINGNPDGSFNPKGSIKRAQMAVVFSNAEKLLVKRSDQTLQGFVTSIDFDQMTIASGDRERTFVISPNMLVYEGDQVKSATDIRRQDRVYIIHYNGSAYYAEIVNDEVLYESISGKLVDKSIENLTVTIASGIEHTTYSLSSTPIVLHKDGRGSSLAELPINSTVELKRNITLSQPVVEQILIKELPLNKKAAGKIHVITSDQLVITDTGASESATYQVSDKPSVHYIGKLIALSELKAEDVVEYEVVNDVVESITLITPSLRTVLGTLTQIDQTAKTLLVRDVNGKPDAYDLAARVTVTIPGLSIPSLKDLMQGDTLELRVDDNKTVHSIKVTNRNIDSGVIATIVSFDSTANELWVRDNNGESLFYKILDSTKITSDGSDVSLTNFPNVFTKGKRVLMTVSNKSLLAIELSSRYRGQITQLDTNQRKLTIKTDEGADISYEILTYATVEVLDKTTATLSDIRVGDSVLVTLNAAQDKVQMIQKRQSKMVRLVKKTASTRKLAVVDQQGKSSDLTVFSTVPMRDASGFTASFDDLIEGEAISVGFEGKTIASIHMASTVRGIVSSTDFFASKLTLFDYVQPNRSVTIRSNATVTYGGLTASSLNAIVKDTRVEIVTASDDTQTIRIIPADEKKFWTYNASNAEMSFKRKTISEKNTFKLYPNAYIHQGAQIISAGSLKDNDTVNVYLIDDLIFEIEKK